MTGEAQEGDPTAQSCGVPASALSLAEVSALPCCAQLVHSTSGQVILLSDASCSSSNNNKVRQCLLVGRTKEADLRIQHGSISRQHAVFYYLLPPFPPSNVNGDNNGQDTVRPALMLRDLGGKHGTLVNGEKINPQPVQLQTGDTVQFGKVRESIFRVEWTPSSSSSSSAPTAFTTTRPNQQSQPTNKDGKESNGKPISTSAEPASTANPSTVQQDQVALEAAGKGLTGRAKRQAEIQAMMASLDQDATYTKVQPTEQQWNQEEEEEDNKDTLRQAQATVVAAAARLPVAPQYASLPVSGIFEIPSEDAADGRLTCVAVDPPGSRLAVGRRNATLSLYDFGGMNDVRRQAFSTTQPATDGQYPLQSLAYSPTGDQILVGMASVQPVVLDRDGQFVLQFARGDMYIQDPSKTIGHTAEVSAVTWHSLERQVVFTAAKDGSVRRWNIETGKLQFEKLCSQHVWVVKSATGHKTAVTSLALHPSGRSFAVGTSDGSVQLWNTTRTRPDKVVVAGTMAVTALCFSVDGKILASRAGEETVAKVWKVATLSRNAQPAFTCLGLPTIHETANVALSPKADFLVAGATALVPAANKGGKPTERGSLNFYDLTQADKSRVEPCVDVETAVGPVTVHWHSRWNQIVTGCSDGSLVVHYDAKATDNSGGVWTALKQSTGKRRVVAEGEDSLEALLRARAREAGPVVAGEILTPLASQPKKRHKKDLDAEAVAKREPERPASGKHKAGGAGSAVTTFAQYIADQSVRQDIAGKDPREALLKYKEGKSYLGNETKILDSKTMEQEEEEER